jgi:hypothetical protein
MFRIFSGKNVLTFTARSLDLCPSLSIRGKKIKNGARPEGPWRLGG